MDRGPVFTITSPSALRKAPLNEPSIRCTHGRPAVRKLEAHLTAGQISCKKIRNLASFVLEGSSCLNANPPTTFRRRTANRKAAAQQISRHSRWRQFSVIADHALRGRANRGRPGAQSRSSHGGTSLRQPLRHVSGAGTNEQKTLAGLCLVWQKTPPKNERHWAFQ